ncbi:sugar ABC transporter ATP-binding protein [Aliamphritea hakodatensis]|uniref:sugar ABC transporter ATP-binding protein n=1 Tax=Aliamphritea hakodatensis TaxID=2895352 RepID=UPI0022FD857C|nr:sugar ABC transporter ATP-binding protein [Aliamphritea hakodatensis]
MTGCPGTTGETGEVVMSARNISRVYGSTLALRDVNFDIHRGQVTTLFGENGAGKSTLMKILSGIVKASSGDIFLDNQPVRFSSSADAQACGVCIIHQELSLAPNMTVRDNIFLGREITGSAGIDFAEEDRQTRQLMQQLEEDISPHTRVEELRLGQQQLVEIARALSVNSRILIMDEPTSALSASEVAVLFRVIHELTARGVSVVYISHHLEEALQITDHAVVLRDGTVTASARRADIDLQWLVRNMVGDHFNLGSPPQVLISERPALAVTDLVITDSGGAGYRLVDGLSLNIHPGEIICIYGLMGAGRTELMECLAGRIRPSGGRVELFGRNIASMTIAQRISLGLVLVPEDRQRDGLVQTMNVGRNLSLASIRAFTQALITSVEKEASLISRTVRDVTVKTASADASVGSLSGGNQQKVVIGKMLATQPKVMLLDEPSRGIDIGAKGEVFRLLASRAEEGLGVLFSTSEVNECLSIAHRIIVMNRGRIAAVFGADASKEAIMSASGESLIA